MDAEIDVRSVENPELTNALSLHGEDQNIAMHASPTAGIVFFVLFSLFPVHLP